MKNLGRTLKQLWRLAYPYWTKSPKRWQAYLLLVASGGLIALLVVTMLRYNTWYADWTNAYVGSNYALWKQQLILFFVIAALMVFGGTFNVYIQGWLMVKWRKWMTSQYLGNWMNNHGHYRMRLMGNPTDNPDQRIQEDISGFIGSAMTYTLTLIQNIAMLGSFMVVLWNLSNTIPMIIGGVDLSFPGYFIVVALIWAVISTVTVHNFGKQLVKLQYNQQMYEADFRFSMVRVREYSEQISLLKGEQVEHTGIMGRFSNVIANTFRLMGRNVKLGMWNTGLSMFMGVIISLLLGPAYFAGLIPGGYGAIMQIAMAFATVEGTFTFFQTSYAGLAAWKATSNRLSDFLENARKSDEIWSKSEISVKEHKKDDIEIKNLAVNLPTGKLQISAKDIAIKHGDKVLIKGKTGAGKTTLFRVLSGLWPFGKGSVSMPEGKTVMVLPQQPYFPFGTLASAISYPDALDKFSRSDIEKALRDVGMEKFIPRLDDVGFWNQQLSGGEQQRVSLSRAILHTPDYLFFDEATSSVDEPSEEVLYKMLLNRMKDSTIISIGHRSSLEKFHDRKIVAEPQNGNFEFVEKKVADKR
jgi:vitamin B12/bleomycin/antimicrobial peptide transport system ATP-binding/permease protein